MSPSASNDSIPSLHDDYLFMGNEREEWEKNQSLAIANARITSETNIKRKPVPPGTLESTLPKSESKGWMTSMPGEFPSERPVAPLRPITPPLPTPALPRVKSKSRGWGIGWSYLMRDTGSNEKCMPHSDSAISLGSNSSSECANCGSSANPSPTKQVNNSFVSQRMARPRNVTPSSSISNVAMRSPLSTMRFVPNTARDANDANRIRTAESPDVAIKPDVALVPTTVPSSLDRISPKKPPITQPLPLTLLNEMMVRRPSVPPPPARMPKPPHPTEGLPIPPKHVTPLKRKPIEAKLTKQSKTWKDTLPVRGGSFEIERKPVATTKDVVSSKPKGSAARPTPKQKTSEARPSLKSWKDSLPIRGGSFEMERSSANIRDIFPNISRGLVETKQPLKPSTNPKQTPLRAKKNSESRTQTQAQAQIPTKSSNTVIVIKKKSAEIKVPGAFLDYAKQDASKERPTSREIKIPGAFIDQLPSDTDKSHEEESIIRKKPQGVRPLKLRPKVKATEKAKPIEKPKPAAKSLVDEPETLYVPAPRGPRDRPFKRKIFGRSNAGVPRNDRDSTQLLDAVQVEYMKVKPLRRLSLGEVSTGMGNLWDD
ncbi:hypothetical protein NHQ30_003842 [Ciborinia camelliae]|nr:hypothetical protein NHQ30_003842 [Ciborinia camelliae]